MELDSICGTAHIAGLSLKKQMLIAPTIQHHMTVMKRSYTRYFLKNVGFSNGQKKKREKTIPCLILVFVPLHFYFWSKAK